MESRQEEGTIKKGERETTKHGQHLSCEYKKEAPGIDTEMCLEQKVLCVCVCVCTQEKQLAKDLDVGGCVVKKRI